jgi:hypothetical protein
MEESKDESSQSRASRKAAFMQEAERNLRALGKMV